MLTFLLALFGCPHGNQSRVYSRKDEGGRFVKEYYRVCLDCARELPYPWAELGQVKRPVTRGETAMEEA